MNCQEHRTARGGGCYSDTAASAEGWRLTCASSSREGSERVEIRKSGPDSPFREDEDARHYVVQRAREGSGIHRDALNRLDRVERNLVRLFCGDWQ